MPSTPAPSCSFQARPASELIARSVSWLWPNRLALGKLAVIEGDPGLNKSFLTLDLCARLSTGRPFPDSSSPVSPGTALILNAEDCAEDTIRGRLQLLGADLSRVIILDHEDEIWNEILRFPLHCAVLDTILKKHQPSLVVIDPVVSFLDETVQTHVDQSVRRALLPLSTLARKYQCAILLIRHLNKTSGWHSMYRGGGSIGLLAACRSAWLVGPDPRNPTRRIFAQIKNNLAPPQPSLAFEVCFPPDGPPSFSWLGSSTFSADQLLAAAKRSDPFGSTRERARDFLTTMLEDGPRTSRDLWPLAEEQGLNPRTIARARKDLQIRSQRLWIDGKFFSYWLLPGQELPDSVPAESRPPSLEPWLAPLREKFPPSTPLDDL